MKICKFRPTTLLEIQTSSLDIRRRKFNQHCVVLHTYIHTYIYIYIYIYTYITCKLNFVHNRDKKKRNCYSIASSYLWPSFEK